MSMRPVLSVFKFLSLSIAALALVGVGLSLDRLSLDRPRTDGSPSVGAGTLRAGIPAIGGAAKLPADIPVMVGLQAVGEDQDKRDEITRRQMQGMLVQLAQLEKRVRELDADLVRHHDMAATTTRKRKFELLGKVAGTTRGTIERLLETAEASNVMVRDPMMSRDHMVRDEMDRLRLHLNSMTTQMHDAVRSMEHIRDLLMYDAEPSKMERRPSSGPRPPD